MQIILLLAATTVVYTLSTILTSRASLRLNAPLAATITNLVSVLLPLVLFLAWKNRNNMPVSKTGLLYAIGAGISIAIFTVLLTFLFSRAENVSFIMPVLYGGTIVLGALVGVLLFREALSPVGMAGIFLISAGISCVIYARLHA